MSHCRNVNKSCSTYEWVMSNIGMSHVMTHSYVWHDSLIRVTWLNHMGCMTLLYVRHVSFISVRHNAFTNVSWLNHVYIWMYRATNVWVMSHMNVYISHMICVCIYICVYIFIYIYIYIHMYICTTTEYRAPETCTKDIDMLSETK